MTEDCLAVLVIGASGSIGRPVADEALRRGHRVRAFARHLARSNWPEAVECVTGDLTRPETLVAAVDGVDAIVFTHGTLGSTAAAEAVDYGGVRNVLAALGERQVQIALMTAIGVTDRQPRHDWKRRAERLVRASGLPYTIVRPGWFDYNAPDQRRLVFLQGDRRQSGTPRDGVIARDQIAAVLVHSLTSAEAAGKTLELVAERGPRQADLDPLFGELDTDRGGALDAAHDADNMPLDREPAAFRDDLRRLRGRWSAASAERHR